MSLGAGSESTPDESRCSTCEAWRLDETAAGGMGASVLCFECHRRRRSRATAQTPFDVQNLACLRPTGPRLTAEGIEHRRRMLAHLQSGVSLWRRAQ